MDETHREKHSFINEKIVPKKKMKKILLIIGLVIVLGAVFGAIAGITFFVSQNVLGAKIVQESQPEAIIIARDDPESLQEENEAETEAEASVPVREETKTSAEALTEKETENSSETEEVPSETTGEEVGPTVITVKEEKEPTVKEIYQKVSDGFVTVAVIETGDVDWFDQTIISREERFGVLIAETEENVFVLMDGAGISDDAEIRVRFSSGSVHAQFYGYDNLTGLAVLRLQKKEMTGASYHLVTLGNSFPLEMGSRVILAGAPYGKPGAIDEGIITYCEKEADTQDGYTQLFYTDMFRTAGGNAVLLNEDGEIVCWASDYSCGISENVRACGISTLKYVIEDLCSGRSTAYFGVRCVTVDSLDSEETGLPEGLYVKEVIPYSPAYEAGIQAGDRIVSVGGKSVMSSHILQNRIDAVSAGSTLDVAVERRGVDQYEALTLKVTFGER